jgi:hypothetical protein
MDAGSDSGFTFTAPNWPSEPRQKISHITAQQPSHPANSFHYPDKKRLPPIATFHFHKVRGVIGLVYLHQRIKLTWNFSKYLSQSANASFLIFFPHGYG